MQSNTPYPQLPPLALPLMNHSVVRLGGVGGDDRSAHASDETSDSGKPKAPFSLKSHFVVGSVTSSIKREVLCGEQQPLWELREGERGDKQGEK